MIVIDLETSGVNPEKNSILSLGAVDFENPENRIYIECRPRDGSDWDDVAEKVHGISESEATRKELSEKELVRKFMEWALPIKNKTLAGQCTHFDWNFLQAAFMRYKLAWIFGHRLIDLHSIAYGLFMQAGHKIPLRDGISDISLDIILVHLGIPGREGFHNALHDALLEAECFSRIMRGKNLLEEFERYPLIERK